jgi:hypothetical protein
MRIPLLLMPLVLLAASCSDDPQPPPVAAKPATPVAQAPAATPATAPGPAPAEQGDVAAAEVVESDPCDLSGYDLSKMTVDMHENLVKRCEMSKE